MRERELASEHSASSAVWDAAEETHFSLAASRALKKELHDGEEADRESDI